MRKRSRKAQKEAEWNEVVTRLLKYFANTGKSIVLIPEDEEMIAQDLLKQPLSWLAGQGEKQRKKVLNCMMAKRNHVAYQQRNQTKSPSGSAIPLRADVKIGYL